MLHDALYENKLIPKDENTLLVTFGRTFLGEGTRFFIQAFTYLDEKTKDYALHIIMKLVYGVTFSDVIEQKLDT